MYFNNAVVVDFCFCAQLPTTDFLISLAYIFQESVYIIQMEDLPADQDDIDFSIISPGNDKPKQLDFSVNQLLQNRETKSNSSKFIPQPSDSKQIIIPEGSFMKDLQKMEKSLSYETNPYDIYEPQEQLAQFTGTFEAKQEDTCTKTTNNMTKLGEKQIQMDFRHLIVDFSQEKCSKLKTKESYEEYFDILPPAKKTIERQKSTKLRFPNPASKILTPKIKTSSSQVSIKSKQKSTRKEVPAFKPTNNKKSQSKGKVSQNKLVHKQQNMKSKTTSRSQSKQTSKNKQRVDKRKSKLQSEVFSQYFGFEEDKTSPNKKKKSLKKSQQKSKKIVYSNKNVNLYH